MNIPHFGFFQDFPNSLSGEQPIRALMQAQPQDEEARIVEYLNSGELFIFCPGVRFDAVFPSDLIIGTGSVKTDGTWVWPDTLPYYVSKYHVRIPPEFIAHMRQQHWMISPADLNLNALTNRWFSDE